MEERVAQCPDCGTTRLVVRTTRDPIDRIVRGPVAWFRRKTGAKLYHCIFCRLQFYSHLPIASPSATCGRVAPTPQS
jgi:DNA-directed RNA polymerase subunit RPC12/RpoP